MFTIEQIREFDFHIEIALTNHVIPGSGFEASNQAIQAYLETIYPPEYITAIEQQYFEYLMNFDSDTDTIH